MKAEPLDELLAKADAEIDALIDKWTREVDDLVEEYAHDTDALLAELELVQIGTDKGTQTRMQRR